MAQFYLINVASMAGNKFLPGALIDSTVLDTTALAAAGAELWPASDATVAAAALKAQAAHRYKGASEEEMAAIMQVAVDQSQSTTVLPATATTAGVQSAAQFNLVGALAGARQARGVCITNMSISAFVGVSGGTPQDGVTYAAGDRVLLVLQTTAAENGLYVVGTVGSGTAPLTRVADLPAAAAYVNGMTVEVSEGTVWAGSTWKAFCTGAKVVGTDDPVFYPRVHKGHGNLDNASPSVLAVSSLFVHAAAECTAINQTTAANAVKAVQAAGGSRGAGTLTVTGPNTVTNTISWTVVNF